MNFHDFVKLMWALDGVEVLKGFGVDICDCDGKQINSIHIDLDRSEIVIFK